MFVPKYRRQIIQQQIKADIGFILRRVCKQKGIEIIEANVWTIDKLSVKVYDDSFAILYNGEQTAHLKGGHDLRCKL